MLECPDAVSNILFQVLEKELVVIDVIHTFREDDARVFVLADVGAFERPAHRVNVGTGMVGDEFDRRARVVRESGSQVQRFVGRSRVGAPVERVYGK